MDLALYSHILSTPRYFAPIAASDSGSTSVVAAVAGKKIVVLRYVLAAAGAVNVKFVDATGDLTGLFPLAEAGDGLDPGTEPLGHFQTRIGEALSINLSGAVVVGGHLMYTLA